MPQADNIATIPTQALDFENKLVLPSKALYQALKSEFHSLYQSARDDLITMHTDLAQATLQLYHHPIETFSTWQGQAAHYGSAIRTEIKERVVPELSAAFRQTQTLLDESYRTALADAAKFGTETREFFEVFNRQPRETSTQLYHLLATGVQSAGNKAWHFYRQAAEQAKSDIETLLESMKQMYDTGMALAMELIEAPSDSAATAYYKLTAALLDLYAQSIGVVLRLLDNGALPNGWVL